MLIVVTKDHEQFKQFLERSGINPSYAMYASSAEVLRGCRGAMYTMYGDWFKRDDLYNMKEKLEAQGAVRVYFNNYRNR